ncbi:hypothetical protein KKD52_00525 [Myxococcota bacterium]|nr:hypothetical protein [Myxococcota bacterium]MBU1411823.1 hypothetical protein [Myxococcota bacterium]MBU1508816.1 hypothetical protein [Myxococcota bacterium]PKN25990.1 MAG: hypothetical protein CVU65_06975 [Deltaproteobacteria bacterium HGW-Deltaproteobacteria-22]
MDHDDLENDEQNPATKLYPDDIKPDKVTFEGYIEAGLLDLPSFDDDDDVPCEPSIVEGDDDDFFPEN